MCAWCLRLSHITHAARRTANCHARLQVVDTVCDERDEDEEDEDDEEDDDVALHFGGCGMEDRVWRVKVFVVVVRFGCRCRCSAKC